MRVLGVIAFLVLAGIAHAEEPNPTDWITFSTDGHPKAKGINMTLDYPASWVPKEGRRPNVVQTFSNASAAGWLEMLTIITAALPPDAQLTRREMEEFYGDPASVKSILPDGAEYISSGLTEIEGLPAGIIMADVTVPRAGLTIQMRMMALAFIWKNTLVQLQFTVSGPPGTPLEKIARRAAEKMALFTYIANSVVIPGVWAVVDK